MPFHTTEYRDKYLTENAERIKLQKREWSAKYRQTEKYRQYQKIWRNKNRDKARKYNARYSNRKRASESSFYDRDIIFDIYGGFCIICDKKINRNYLFPNPKAFTIHHLIPISIGGNDSANNVAPAHWVCNLRVGNKKPIAVKPIIFNG